MQANDVQSYEKNSIIRDAVADGEIEVGLINHYYILEGIREGEVDGENYPVKLHFFPGGDVGSLVNVAGIGLLKSAEQGDNAQKFTDFLLEQPQQEYFAQDVGEYPLVGRRRSRTRRCRRSRTSRRPTWTWPTSPTSRGPSSCSRRPARSRWPSPWTAARRRTRGSRCERVRSRCAS